MSDEDDVLTLPDRRVRSFDAVAERLDDPKTAASVLDLLDVLPTLAGTLQILDGFYTHSEHILDNVRDSLVEIVAKTSGTPEAEAVAKVVTLGRQALPVAGQVADSALIEKLSDSGLIEKAADAELLATLTALLDAVSKAKTEAGGSHRKLGVFGLLGALRDPDVSRGLEFMLNALKVLGAGLGPSKSTTMKH